MVFPNIVSKKLSMGIYKVNTFFLASVYIVLQLWDKLKIRVDTLKHAP